MEAQKVFYEFLIVTVPAVVLYFTGWGYLYFFLGAFDIDIAEIHIDVPTVFIYSLPVLQDAVRHYGYYLLGGTIGFLIASVIIFGEMADAGKASLRGFSNRVISFVSKVSIWTKLTVSIALLALLVLGLVPIISTAAQDTANRIWAGPARYVVAAARTASAEASAGQSQPTDSPAWKEQKAQYDACSAIEALRLVYADDNTYYLLCRNDENSTQGTVFEVRRKEGLVSVRFPQKEGRP
jgi:hypothetical protein